MNEVFYEDCLDTMDRFPSNYIKLTVTSPPYGKLRLYHGFCFDFENTAKELYRVTQEGGVVVWNVCDSVIKGSETGDSFKQALYFLSIGFKLHDTMIWDKKDVFGTAGNPPLRYQQAFEYIFVFVKGTIKTFNPIRVDCLEPGRVYSGKTRRDRRSSKTTDCLTVKRNIANHDTKIHNNIFTYAVGFNKTTSDKIAFKHPAIFPDQLALDMITSFSDPGDIVYDPFTGSGTTLKMAKKSGRKYLGSEISIEYKPIIEERLKL